jgi:hypothetical protein
MYGAVVQPNSLILPLFNDLFYQPWMVDGGDGGDDCGGISGNLWQWKLKNTEKTFPSAALSTTDPT